MYELTEPLRDDEETHIEVLVLGLVTAGRNDVHVDVERQRRRGVEADGEAGLFSSLAQGGARQVTVVGLLGVASGLKPAVQLSMEHQTHSEARLIDHQRAPGEVGGPLATPQGSVQ
jgi:hypothetical protein